VTTAALLGLSILSPTIVAAPLGTDLLDAVPADTASACSWTSSPETAQFEGEVLEVVDAILAARFDDFLFESMTLVGAPPEFVTELSAIRNVFTTIGGVVPWRGLLGQDLVYAETPSDPFLPGVDCPSMIFLCRPDPASLEAIEAGMAGVLGALAARLAGPIRYDIHRQPELGTTIYELILRGDQGDTSITSVALFEDTLLIGLGQEYFESSLELLRGGQGPRLTKSIRWKEAFGDLPGHSTGRSYLDVPRMVDGFEDLAALISDRSFNAGFWQGNLNEIFELAGSIETVAATVDLQGDRLVTRSLTRMNSTTSPLVRSGLSQHSSGELLEYVPHDVVAFSSRGDVDLDPIWQWTRSRLSTDWSAGDDLLWLAELAQATLDLWIDRDLLSWVGSEHINMTVPSSMGAGTETVLITKLANKEGARRCIARIEGVLGVLLPRLVGSMQDVLVDLGVPFDFDIQLVDAAGPYPGLKQLVINAGPMPIPSITYGFLGNLFVATTSERSLEHCLAVAVGEEDGLWEHDLMAEYMGRDDLNSASLVPVGLQLAESMTTVTTIHGVVRGMLAQLAATDPQVMAGLNQFSALVDKLTGIMAEIDFLGDAVTICEEREGGLARYEVTTQALIGFPSRALSSPITQR
jgi:hypothetical protein